ncbi:E3 ubiquitin-protein ligase SPL2-like [Papaver somniferum]|uniref:E3 ubiquitin-protein ligase SPL2-like n=1 Tax=Papaver somniferum TaxID=3469 RepID=UPI000E6FEE6C|nr:E3 ubiquitin-protein ligase SPL2-like [Papaver somniferum]
MTTNDQTIAFLAQVVSFGDGAVFGTAIAFAAVKAWQSYFFNSSALNKVLQAPNVRVSDLRQLLVKEGEAASGGGDDGGGGGGGGDGGGGGWDGKLVVVRGIVEAKRSVDGWKSSSPNVLISKEAGERAVILQNIQTCVYNEWRGLLGWTSDLRTVFLRSWKDQKSTSVRMVPFVLLDTVTGRSSTSDNLFVNMDDSKHPLPLSTVYHKLTPVQTSSYTFLQAVFGHAYPVALLDEEKVLSVGKQISAVGICSFKDGVPQIKSSHDLPCFLTEKTKDQLVVDLAFNTKCLVWGGLILGSLSVGILGYATIRNWKRWKEWRQRRENERASQAEAASAMDTEAQADEIAGEVPDGELCAVCLIRRRSAAFVPCGHMVCCYSCSLTVRRESSPKCPVCRQPVTSSVRIYAS